jgi:hypothetical protein
MYMGIAAQRGGERDERLEDARSTHEWRAVDGGRAATVCHLWCALCGTLWEVADPDDVTRTNWYFVVGASFEQDELARPQRGLREVPPCAPRSAHPGATDDRGSHGPLPMSKSRWSWGWGRRRAVS